MQHAFITSGTTFDHVVYLKKLPDLASSILNIFGIAR